MAWTPEPPFWATVVSVALRELTSHAESRSPLGSGSYSTTYFMGLSYFLLHLFICVGVGRAHVTVLLWRPEASLRAWVLCSTVWVSEIKFRLSGLAVPLSTEPSPWPQKVAQANLKHPPRTYPAGRTTTMDC